MERERVDRLRSMFGLSSRSSLEAEKSFWHLKPRGYFRPKIKDRERELVKRVLQSALLLIRSIIILQQEQQ